MKFFRGSKSQGWSFQGPGSGNEGILQGPGPGQGRNSSGKNQYLHEFLRVEPKYRRTS